MAETIDKAFLLSFIKRRQRAVVATVNQAGEPEAALIGYGETDNFEILFGTNRASRKYRNLQANPKAALVIGMDDDQTLQYEGIAEEIVQDADIEQVKGLYYAKTPEARRYENEPGQTYFKVQPRWLRFTDISTDPDTIVEITF